MLSRSPTAVIVVSSPLRIMGSVRSERRSAMRRMLGAAGAAAVVAGALVAWAPWASGAGEPTYEPQPNPSGFPTTIDNPYFPLPVGRVLVYQGVKDGQPQIDTVTVTGRTKLVAEGVTARVVKDVATTKDGKLLEKTFDYYAQDAQGNVWYVGEDTT